MRLKPALTALIIVGSAWAALASATEEPTLVEDDNAIASSDETTGEDSVDGSAEPEENKQTTFAIGDTVALGNFQLTVNGIVDPQPPADEFSAPDEGQRWISVDVTVENVGTEPEIFSSLLAFELQDSEAFTYDPEFASGVEPQAPDGELAPASKKRGLIVFAVPETASGLTLNFSGELFTTGSATVSLS